VDEDGILSFADEDGVGNTPKRRSESPSPRMVFRCYLNPVDFTVDV
jgi:hypothetical protein